MVRFIVNTPIFCCDAVQCRAGQRKLDTPRAKIKWCCGISDADLKGQRVVHVEKGMVHVRNMK